MKILIALYVLGLCISVGYAATVLGKKPASISKPLYVTICVLSAIFYPLAWAVSIGAAVGAARKKGEK
jgi:hypothetical protein